MAHDKNPTEQLRIRIPATHSERSGIPSSGDKASGNPWDALQAREDRWNSPGFLASPPAPLQHDGLGLCACAAGHWRSGHRIGAADIAASK